MEDEDFDDVEYYEDVTSNKPLSGEFTWNLSTEHNYEYFNTYN